MSDKKEIIEISVEEFKSMSEKENSGVNWDKVLGDLSKLNKVVDFNYVKDKVKKEYKSNLYRSVWMGVLERREEKKEIEVISKKLKVGNRLRRYWLIKML